MDLGFSENQLLYVDTVRRLVKNEISPRILEMEKEHGFQPRPGGPRRHAEKP